MKLHILIAGGRKKARALASLLKERDCKVTLISKDPDFAKAMAADPDLDVICGEAAKPWVLEQAGALQADTLVALCPEDEDNLVICETAKLMFGVPRTISLLANSAYEPLFEKAGIDYTVSAASIISNLIEQQIVHEKVESALGSDASSISVLSLTIPRSSPVCHQQIQSLALPPQTVIGSMIRSSGLEIPHGGSVIQPMDTLVVLTRKGQEQQAADALGAVMVKGSTQG